MFSDVVVVSDLNKNFDGSTGLAKNGPADLHTPFRPPPPLLNDGFLKKMPKFFLNKLVFNSSNVCVLGF